MPEQVPGPPKGVTVETLAGNHLVVDMGDGNFALYAHLKTGTVAVKVGDHVKTGDVLGHLGNTGISSAPFAFSRDGRTITASVARVAV